MKLYDDKLTIKNIHFLWKTDYNFPLKLKAKIRYRQADQDCTIKKEDINYIVKLNGFQYTHFNVFTNLTNFLIIN